MDAPKLIEESISAVTAAWQDLTPDKSFGGMTLDQFKARVKPSLDARGELATAKNTRINALTGRMLSDEESQKAILLVVNAIKGDPTEGEDSALYEACGYVPKSKRKSGLSRKAKTAVTQVPASQP